jgi:hypothetical protein
MSQTKTKKPQSTKPTDLAARMKRNARSPGLLAVLDSYSRGMPCPCGKSHIHPSPYE